MVSSSSFFCLLTLILLPITLGVLAFGSTPATPCAPPKNAIIVGGSSGMGKAAALAVLQRGGKVLLVSRSEEKLLRAKEELTNQVGSSTAAADDMITIRTCDASDEDQVADLAASLIISNNNNDDDDGSTTGEDTTATTTSAAATSQWDGLVISAAAKAPHGPVATLPTDDTKGMMESKVWTAYHCVKHFGPILKDGGSVVFVAGILNRRPGMNCAPLAMANGALEGLTRSLALEWGPRLRVNCLSPGFCETERFDHMDLERKQRMLDNTAASLPLQRVGQPQDMGEAIYYLLTATFCTGVILDVDGGHGIRQYANPTTDPMRK